jgi:hypothetical protein
MPNTSSPAWNLVDVVAAADDQIVLPVYDEEEAVVVAKVAGVQPAVDQDARGGHRISSVAAHHVHPAHDELTDVLPAGWQDMPGIAVAGPVAGVAVTGGSPSQRVRQWPSRLEQTGAPPPAKPICDPTGLWALSIGSPCAQSGLRSGRSNRRLR